MRLLCLATRLCLLMLCASPALRVVSSRSLVSLLPAPLCPSSSSSSLPSSSPPLFFLDQPCWPFLPLLTDGFFCAGIFHISTDRFPSQHGWARFACDVRVDDERAFMVDVKIFFGKRAAPCLLPLRVDECVEKGCLIRQLKSMHARTPKPAPQTTSPLRV